MKVKYLRDLLYRLSEDDEVVLLNDAAPITATNAITQVYTVAEPVENTETDDVVTKLILAYSTRERGEK